MTREEILKEIDEVIKYNKAARGAEVTELFKDATRKSNDVLAKAKRYIDVDSNYERGMEDAWELARKIGSHEDLDGFTFNEMEEIFGDRTPSEVFEDYEIHDAMKAYKEWLKEKEEADKKPKTGDVVEVTDNIGGYSEKGVFMSEGRDGFTYISKNGLICVAKKANFSFRKTGEHVDILGMLDKI